MAALRTCSSIVHSCLAAIFFLCAQPAQSENLTLHSTACISNRDALNQALAQLDEYGQIQKQLKIQQPDIAYAMRKARTLAELLIQPDGILNYAIIPNAKMAFVPAQPQEYELQIQRVLDQLDASWQPFFDQIKAPLDPHSTGFLVLRSLFEFTPEEQIVDWHAKVAVLSALFAPYNQGSVGDCFAVNVVIRDHEEHLRHAAADYQSAIMNGYLQRSIDGQSDNFFFLPILADTDRDQPFTLSKDGYFSGTQLTLFDAPGFSAARDLMGGCFLILSDVLHYLSFNSKNSIRVTPSQIIHAIAQAVYAQDQSQTIATLQSLGEYGFSSLTNHPVLRGVEAAFSSMAENRPHSSTRSNINAAVSQSMQSAWSALRAAPNAIAFQNIFNQTFNNSYRLLYNLNIPLAKPAADGSSINGGFQLYERVPGSIEQLGTRVETPSDFLQLVINAISATATQINLDTTNIVNYLNSYVQNPSFMQKVLWNYDPANKQVKDPVRNYLTLNRTPMQSCDGDNPFEVININIGIEDTDQIYYTPSNAKDLLVWVLNLAKKAPQSFCSMVSPQHAFNFAPHTEELRAFVQSRMTPDQWIKQTLITPGMQVATRPATALFQQNLTQRMQQVLSSALPDLKGYNALTKKLTKQPLTVQQYASQFLSGLIKLLHANADVANQLTVALDAEMLLSISSSDAALLGKSAIRFAETNWNVGTEDLYFCSYFNPRTMDVGFGVIEEDKMNLQPMDEAAWVNHLTWGVDITPQAPKAAGF